MFPVFFFVEKERKKEEKQEEYNIDIENDRLQIMEKYDK